MKADQFAKLANVKAVTLTIKAQIKPNAATGKQINNTAKVGYVNNVDSTGEKETKPVTVTPPPTSPTIEKSVVNGEESATATEDKAGDKVLTIDRAKTYDYKVKVALPADIEAYKSFVITDTLDKDLTFATDKDGKVLPVAQVLSIEGADAALFDLKLDGQTATATVKADQFAKLANVKAVTLTIKAQIKPNAATGKQINNTAKVDYVNNVDSKGEKETKPVTVTPPPTSPTIEKSVVNGEESATATEDKAGDKVLTIDRAKTYDYKVKVALPADIEAYKSFVITDTLDKDLTFATDKDGKVLPVAQVLSIEGADAALFDLKLDGQTATATVKADQFAKLANVKAVTLTIKAQIKPNAATGKQINNTAKVDYVNNVDSTGEKETKPVTVTPPPKEEVPPTVDKKINGDLTNLQIDVETPYTYNITSKLPADIDEYQAFVITDEVDERLTVTEAVITGDVAKAFDQVTTQVQANGKTLVTATVKDFASLKGVANVELVITAQIKKSVKAGAEIPNTAKINFINQAGQSGEKPTEPVVVTPPPKEEVPPTVDKKINKDLTELEIDVDKAYTYNITSKLPADIVEYESFVITDTVDNRLTVTEAVITGDVAKAFVVDTAKQADGSTLVTATVKDFAALKDVANVELVITAKINKSVKAGVTIPNTAEVDFTNDSGQAGHKRTQPVIVTPPPKEDVPPTLDKKINKDLTELEIDVDKAYTYNITSKLPADIVDYENFVITDTVDNRLTVTEAVITGDAAKAFEVKVAPAANGTLVTATVKDFASLKGVTNVELVITAKINKSVKAGTVIPNTAEVDFTNGSGQSGHKPTEPVTVTPPPTEPEITKVIEDGLTHLDIENEKAYAYYITSVLPSDIEKYESYVITDTVDARLTVKEVTLSTPEGAFVVTTSQDKDGNTLITATADPAQLAGVEVVEMVVTAEIKAGVRDEKIPNIAELTFVNSKGQDGYKPTEPVTVTPPPVKEVPPTLDKVINGDQTDLTIDRETAYVYNIVSQLPANIADYENFVITDAVDKRLDVTKAEIVGTAAKAFDKVAVTSEADGTTLVVAQAKDFAALKGIETVELRITAQIKASAKADVAIPNTAVLDYAHQPGQDGQVVTEPVRVTPPPVEEVPPTPEDPEVPQVDKAVNGKTEAILKAIGETFTYTIDTQMTKGAQSFEIQDTLEPVLVFNGEVVVTADQVVIQPRIEIDGQTLTISFTEAQIKAYAGQALRVTFDANIKSGADLSAYLDKASDTTPVPNIASIILNNDAKTKQTTEPVHVVPPTPETPTPNEPSKVVEDVDGKRPTYQKPLSALDSKFRFRINADLVLGGNLSELLIEDQLEPVLEITDNRVEVAVAAGQKDEYVAPARQAFVAAEDKLKALMAEAEKASTTKAQAELEAQFADLTKEKAALVKAYEEALKAYEKQAPTAPQADLAKLEAIVAELLAELDKATEPADQATLEQELAKAQDQLRAAQADLADYEKALQAYEADAPVLATDKVDKALADVEAQLKALSETATKQTKEMEALAKEIEDVLFPAAEAEVALYQAIEDNRLLDYLLKEKLAKLTIEGNTVKLALTDPATLKSLEGLQLQLLIYANIRPDADLSAYLNGTWVEVPNTATVHFDHEPKVTNKVTVVPPTEDPNGPTPNEPEEPTTPPTDEPKEPTPPSEPPVDEPKTPTPTTPKTPSTPSPTPIKTVPPTTPSSTTPRVSTPSTRLTPSTSTTSSPRVATSSYTPATTASRSTAQLPKTGSQARHGLTWMMASALWTLGCYLLFKNRKRAA